MEYSLTNMEKEKYTFFWGGSFSNFYTSYFVDKDGISYNCVEQFYAAKKAIFFGDKYRLDLIMATKDPKKQKRHARAVINFDEKKWYGDILSNPAKNFMYEGNFYKYTQNEKFKKLLIDTQGTSLVEASPYDKVWGIGMQEGYLAKNKKYWKGTNWLGEILTLVREDILKKEEPKGLLF